MREKVLNKERAWKTSRCNQEGPEVIDRDWAQLQQAKQQLQETEAIFDRSRDRYIGLAKKLEKNQKTMKVWLKVNELKKMYTKRLPKEVQEMRSKGQKMVHEIIMQDYLKEHLDERS